MTAKVDVATRLADSAASRTPDRDRLEAHLKDTLYLLSPGFRDPAYQDRIFYCWHCALLEGILASFPDQAAHLDVRRISWPLPRTEIVDLLGEDNQSLPVLVLAEGGFLNDKDAILAALTDRHGFPHPHP